MSLSDMMNPTGGVHGQRVMGSGLPEEDLLERILSTANMKKAWERVKKNKGASGVDNVTVDDFPERFRPEWPRIRKSLMEESYTPSPVLRVEIPKDNGGKRPLGIPIVLDRLIQQAIAQVLIERFDPGFSPQSYGFRPERSAHQAIRAVRGYVREGYGIAVDMDLSKFFDTVDHDILMNRVARKVRDKRVLRLIGKYLRSGVVHDGRLQTTSTGVPQGGPLSPLLANIMLDDLDKELESRGHRFARYADDFIILVKSRRSGERVMESVRNFLETRLKLTVNEIKSHVDKMANCVFLGFTIIRGKIRWSEKSFMKFKQKLRKLTGRSWGVSMEYRLFKIAEYVRGWMGYYGISEYYRPLPDLDGWLRRRIRMCYWKRWRKCRTKVRNLTRLGVDLHTAITAGMSRKGPWRLSRTFATNSGMSDDWLRQERLISIRDQWIRIHYPATAR